MQLTEGIQRQTNVLWVMLCIGELMHNDGDGGGGGDDYDGLVK